jgi:hypothetical protein
LLENKNFYRLFLREQKIKYKFREIIKMIKLTNLLENDLLFKTLVKKFLIDNDKDYYLKILNYIESKYNSNKKYNQHTVNIVIENLIDYSL